MFANDRKGSGDSFMRVIAGSARGRRLRCLRDRRIRPTQDRVKEAVFSSLTPRLSDSRVLDLFAGSGALGIEALSRGAGAVTFVEKDEEACRLIQENLSACGWQLSSRVRLLQKDILRWLPGGGAGGQPAPQAMEQYDIILADPPYRQGYEDEILALLSRHSLLSSQGILVLESEARQELPEQAGRLSLHKSKTYGDTKISYYTNLS
jgi:16S rRNA (guanine(966)-N(2))-methyltransferase RsmD